MFERQLQNRDEFIGLIDAMELKTAAEIGTATGLFSAKLLRSKLETLYMVDTWMSEDPGNIANTFRPDALAVANAHPGRAVMVEKASVVFASEVPDESIDFVYIDTKHEEPYAHEDVAAWWPKARCVLAGHDYTPCNMQYAVPYGVMQAAEDLAAEHGLTLYVTGAKSPTFPERLRAALASLALADIGPFGAHIPSWYVFKQCTP